MTRITRQIALARTKEVKAKAEGDVVEEIRVKATAVGVIAAILTLHGQNGDRERAVHL